MQPLSKENKKQKLSASALFRESEQGSALVYILIAIALLAALTVSFMQPSSQQVSSQNTFKTVSAMQSQVNVIRAAIQECILVYPGGDNTINSGLTTDPDARTNYPIKPNSTHFNTATIGPTTGTRWVRDIRCPGNPGNDVNHAKIFGQGKFLPPAPDLFEDWEYYNGEDGVFFWTRTDNSDAFLFSALAKLDENFSECEADVVDASTANRDFDSNSEVACPSGSTCFRVWMVQDSTAVFNGDTDGDEAAC